MSLHKPVILYLFLTMTAATEDGAYCAIRYTRLCQEKGQHIGCQYPYLGPGESCENYTKIEFTEELRNFVLHYINRHRQRIAAGHEKVRGGLPIPKPDIMMYVEWDRELAYLAQRLADQCRFVHDECRATVRYPYAGQTVGEVRWRRTRDSDQLTAQRAIRKVFDAWWGEKRRVQPRQLTTSFKVTAKGTIWGHFSQLAVWKLRAIGCGAVRHGRPHPRLLLVCDYSHTNMLGQKTISAGPLATCPSHTARRPHSQYPLLCSTIKYPLTQQELYTLDYDKEPIRTESGEDTVTDTAVEEEETTTRTTEVDIFVKRTRHKDQKESTYEEDDCKDTDSDGDIEARNQMKNIQEYVHEEDTTTHKEADFNEERDNIIVSNNKEGGKQKNTHLSHQEDYSVIPIKNGRHDEVNDVNVPWRPKQARYTTQEPDYDTSIVRKKSGYRHPTATAVPAGVGVLREIKRKYHDRERILRLTSRARAKDLQHSTARKPLGPSLKLDKDDIDQLFRDTGFKPNWTPKK